MEFSRREVLQASVGGAAIPFALNTAVAKQDPLPVVEHHHGTWNNPLDLNQMMKIKRRAVDRHIELGGKAPNFYVDAVPGFPNYAKLVDNIVGVRPDGIPTQHVGVAGSNESVSSVHKDAESKLPEVAEKARGSQ